MCLSLLEPPWYVQISRHLSLSLFRLLGTLESWEEVQSDSFIAFRFFLFLLEKYENKPLSLSGFPPPPDPSTL